MAESQDYRSAEIIESFPRALGRREWERDDLLRHMAGAIIIRIGSIEDADLEGGGLVVDYKPRGANGTVRVVFAFNELGLWPVWQGSPSNVDNFQE
jgi:hypothetical protein